MDSGFSLAEVYYEPVSGRLIHAFKCVTNSSSGMTIDQKNQES